MYRNPLAYPVGRAPGFDPTHVANIQSGFVASAAMSMGPTNLVTGKAGIVGVGGVQPTFNIDKTIGPYARCAATGAGWEFSFGDSTIENNGTLAAIFLTSNNNAAICETGSNTSIGLGLLVNSGAFILLIKGIAIVSSTIAPTAIEIPYFVATSYKQSASVANFVVVNLLTGSTTLLS